MSKVKIIAEAGVNHNGDVNVALELASAAKVAGADIVKFQTFIADNLVTRSADKAAYQSQNTAKNISHYEMLKSLELCFSDFEKLRDHCNEIGIEFLSTAFDDDSLQFLSNNIGQRLYKIPSGEINNAPFVFKHACIAERIILSTGMATLGEIEQALSVLALGFLNPHETAPSANKFENAYRSEIGQQALRERVCLLHCTSHYPADIHTINLECIKTLKQAFGCDVGYSDHTNELITSPVAVALGASVIEKHFTLDKNLPGPDHKASLDATELTEMIRQIRVTEQLLGSGIKFPQEQELDTRRVARKSIVASKAISKGEAFNQGNICIKRPGSGVSPIYYWEYLTRSADKDYSEEALIF